MTKDITLCVGDAHVEPGQNLRRFKALGNFLRSTPVQRVVLMGDFVSFDSLSAWDRDKRKRMEHRRYAHDINAGRAALSYIESGALVHGPELIYLEGNHEDRVTRYLDIDPTFDGAIHVPTDLCPDWKWVPFKSDYNHAGVSFTHIPHNEAGKAIGGKGVCDKALNLYHNSVIFGHTHGLSASSMHRHNAPHLNQAINVGCFFEHVAEYARGSITSYWRGIVLVDHVSHNRVDVQTISLSRLLREYGDKKDRSG